MPGKKPSEAVREYIQPLQQSLSCFTNSVLRSSGPYEPDKVLVATFSGTTARLRTKNSEQLHLGFVQHFSIKSHLLGYKIKTRSYYYSLEDKYGHEIVAFHWHPDSENGDVPFAHMHLGHGAAERLRKELYKIHFPTARISFEEVGILLLDHFEVEPERKDAKDVLNANLELFKKHKTW